ncbi:hypothetical protein BN405_2-10_Ab1_orf_43 [Pseudomonas phage vB_PaeM_C2-10_Ab1]|uniref:Uncharacterized protein n=1 Tax=Pseudomonas phage vB_PaeM_C2-10_Ab1 TaxID=1231048 RepID=K4RI25_9CAUD|nr:hypothetical protein BN405_2-10_Ab1_orf_43 [Pseudomonas phage vB_PaeM_C2-10_Ab1]CCM43587.1 unnamed protein product [Pseudomonas phage vB_PaeM_C2-10_Ab1]
MDFLYRNFLSYFCRLFLSLLLCAFSDHLYRLESEAHVGKVRVVGIDSEALIESVLHTHQKTENVPFLHNHFIPVKLFFDFIRNAFLTEHLHLTEGTVHRIAFNRPNDTETFLHVGVNRAKPDDRVVFYDIDNLHILLLLAG